jgi:hypothetical protein
VALVRNIERQEKVRHRVHGEVECSGSVFSVGGDTYLQLDTFGSPAREQPGTLSQALQFDRRGAEQLLRLILETFPELRPR